MLIEKRIARDLIQTIGREEASARVKVFLDGAMKGGSIRDIERQHFWREVLIELMKAKDK